MKFSKVTYTNLNGPIASVDRITKELFIDREKWDRTKLTDLHKKFILLHESAHIELLTPDEFAVNHSAIEKFVPVGELSNEELGARILVLSDLLDTEGRDLTADNRSDFDPVTITAITGAVGGIFGSLPKLGIGSKSRVNEIQAQAAAQSDVTRSQNKALTNTLIIGGFLILILGVVFFTFKS